MTRVLYISSLFAFLSLSVWADVNVFDFEKATRYTYENKDKSLKMSVELEEVDPEKVIESVDENRAVTSATLGNKKLPADILFYPYKSYIKSLKIEYKNKVVSFPAKYWSDLAGMRLYTCVTELDLSKKENKYRFDAHVAENSSVPNIQVCDTGHCFLLKWTRREDGDTSTTFTWLISMDGTVIRHEKGPPADADY